ncbi:hypothetical protein RND61_15230 [Streptomyces sp. TRM76323]|uniref:Uncharacterized protein n=1 Tax=Streptomyces tamarix TaxID=3078565 RepID=A0ABU3QKU7_9ACTN|nr:hypothetical protein [Streptomyces tamarix]MDT9683400.1 hypothetical protein [Streptomyces tamarix]
MPKAIYDKSTGFTRIERSPEEQLVIENRKALKQARIRAEELVNKLQRQSDYYDRLIKDIENAKENNPIQ